MLIPVDGSNGEPRTDWSVCSSDSRSDMDALSGKVWCSVSAASAVSPPLPWSPASLMTVYLGPLSRRPGRATSHCRRCSHTGPRSFPLRDTASGVTLYRPCHGQLVNPCKRFIFCQPLTSILILICTHFNSGKTK